MSLIDSVKSQAEKLFTDIDLLLEEGQKQLAHEEQLKGLENGISLKNRKLEEMQLAFKKERQDFTQEKQFIIRESARLKAQELQLNKRESGLNIQEEGLARREQEVVKKEQILVKKEKQFAGQLEKERELIHREAVIEREKTIDRERKSLLDVREKRVVEKEDYINKISQL